MKKLIAITAVAALGITTVGCSVSSDAIAPDSPAEKIFDRPSQIETTTDELTGTKQHLLTLRASTGEDNALIGGKAGLVVRCNAQGFDAYVVTPTYNGFMNDNTGVALRWDEKEISRENWNQGTAGLGGAYFTLDPSMFLSNLIKAEKLAFGWTPYQKQQQSVRFDLANHKADLQKMQKLCSK